MPFLPWNPSYSVDVESLDDDHKHLFSLISNLHEAMGNQQGASTVQHMFTELEDYVTHHFAAEERIMLREKFPDLKAHQIEHRGFIKDLERIQKELRDSNAGLSLTMIVFLHDWMSSHILRTDKQYAEFFRAKQRPAPSTGPCLSQSL